MKRTSQTSRIVLVGAIVFCTGNLAFGQELLINGSLDVPDIHESDVATGWTLIEGPDTMPEPPAVPMPANSATFARFADHTSADSSMGRGLWLQSFRGGLNDEQPPTVFAHLTQDVPGVPGLPYELSAWSRFEAFYPGGVTNLNDGDGDPSDDGPPSPTDTFLALEFLDAGNSVLPGSVELDLRTEQTSDNTWRQHFLTGTAPAGTINVRVRGSMIDGVLNPGVNPQSAFLDDFSLRAIPEPASVVLAIVGFLGVLMLARRR
jgi:hypothetical protein